MAAMRILASSLLLVFTIFVGGCASTEKTAVTTPAVTASVEEAKAPYQPWYHTDLGQTSFFQMQSAPYPHESRKDGFQAKDQLYPRDPHYVDSTVALFIPTGYTPGDTIDLLFYTHGHRNSVAAALEKFRIREQVVASHKNVILVFPEGPKDAPDSGLGKLEDPDGLKNLAAEVLETLKNEGKIPHTNLGRVVLSGHSGAYKGIAMSLKQGGLDDHISEVYLLDASYALTEEYADWAVRREGARLASIYTDHLEKRNEEIMALIDAKSRTYYSNNDVGVTDDDLKNNSNIFVHTTLTHDETVRWLERFLKTSGLDEIK